MSGLSRFGRAASFVALIVISQLGLFSHAGAQVSTKTVALSGTPAPGASTNFASFATPQALNHTGQAAFIGFLTGANGWSHWRGSSNTDLTLVSREWDTAPGTGGRTFLNYAFAEVNDSGRLAFTAELTEYGSTASTNDFGMWMGESPATLTFVMRKGDVAPGAGGKIFGNPGPPALNNAGQVVFNAFLLNPDNTSAGRGIWTGSNSADLTLIARTGDSTPTGGVFSDFSAPDLNNSGEMSFSTNGSTHQAIWFWKAEVFTPVARTGVTDPTQGGPGGGVSFVGFLGELGKISNVNEKGEVAFHAVLSNFLNQGIWVWKKDPVTGIGALTAVARSGEAAPGTAFTFAGHPNSLCSNANPCFKYPVLNGKGEIAFPARLSDGNSGIWVWNGSTLTLVARTGVTDPAQGGPGDSQFFSVFGEDNDSSPAFNSQGELLFKATLSDKRKGIWAWNGNTLTLVARTGDQLTVAPGDSRTITDLFVRTSSGSEEDGRRSGFNDAAEATFKATFTGGSQGIFIAKVFEHPPVANAGLDQTANEGEVMMLDGTGSRDADRDSLTYQWTQVAGPSVALGNSNTSHPSFIACCVPAGGATLTFELTVSDGHTAVTDTVDITVTNVNHPPVAGAGEDQIVQEGSPVSLDGSFSYDSDNETLTFSWEQTAGTLVSLTNANTAHPSFTAPLVGPAGETLTFRLTVSDGIVSVTDTVNVAVDNVNHQPSADAGDDQTIDEGGAVELDSSASNDPDADDLTYTWTQVSGPTVTLSDEHSATPTFTAPMVNAGGVTLVFALVVNDGLLDSSLVTVTITVRDVNDPPACNLAQANPNWLWPPNHKLIPLTITGVTDPNDDAVTITVTSVTQDEPVNGLGDGDTSPDAVPQDNGVLLRAERAGNSNGRVYRVTFTAADGASGSCTGTVTICVPQNSKTPTCVDNGQSYNSQQP